MSSASTSNSQIPFVTIGLSLPTGKRNSYLGSTGIEDNWHKENFASGTVPTTGALLSQEFDIRAFIYPTTQEIFQYNPQFFLFRTTNRNNHADNSAFVADGHQWVHPTNYVVGGNLTGHRYYCGNQNNADLDRITEFLVNPSGDFYGGRADDPNGTAIKFQPLAWFSQPKAIQDNAVTFPQPFNDDLGTGIRPFAGIDYMRVSDGTNAYYFKYGAEKVKYGKAKQSYLFGIGLMIENPDYDGGTKIAKHILKSNIVPFTLGFKKQNFKDIDSIKKKFATDWNLKLGTPAFKM
jgi:hypothetical protein